LKPEQDYILLLGSSLPQYVYYALSSC